MADAADSSLQYIFNHVFLPPRLPQQNDWSPKDDRALVESVLDALRSFIALLPPNQRIEQFTRCCQLLENWLKITNPFGALLEKGLQAAIDTMEEGHILMVHIRGQNAGLIIRRLTRDYHFEIMQLSTPNDVVVGTKGRVRRRFPDRAHLVKASTVRDPSFLSPFVRTLVQLDLETPSEVAATSRKAGRDHVEVRNIPQSGLITEMVSGILAALGEDASDVARIYKNTRDDVLWNDCFAPWRRTPLWLLVRVALQTSLFQASDPDQTDYKSFMIYFMAKFLNNAKQTDHRQPLLFIMSRKIDRRLLKLRPTTSASWILETRNILLGVHSLLSRQWEEQQHKQPNELASSFPWELDISSLPIDLQLSLASLGPYLDIIASRSHSAHGEDLSQPSCQKRVHQSPTLLPNADVIQSEQLSLHDLEIWVEKHLSSWTTANVAGFSSPVDLARLLNVYRSKATTCYRGDPVNLSIMILTIMELWISLDKCVINQIPMLADYRPEIPDTVFEPLILQQRNQMERLLAVEQYIRDRNSAGTASPYPSLFTTMNQVNSFGVRYFEQSEIHKSLKHQIELDASKERERKRTELAEAKKRYERLNSEASGMQHTSIQRINRRGYPYTQHPKSCQKCLKSSQASNMEIHCHEWPLPSTPNEAKAAVFELDVPKAFLVWRETTYMILTDVLSREHVNNVSAFNRSGNAWYLSTYDGLSKYRLAASDRLRPGSTVKPFVVAHYSKKSVSTASVDNICVPNAMRYEMFDCRLNTRSMEVLGQEGIRRQCTFKVPSGAYSGLSAYLENTVHTSNQVIASQSNCPVSISLDEFYAFGSLRAGHRLQWYNIAREVVTRMLNFNQQEIYHLLAQAAWQAGPAEGNYACRETHMPLEDEAFGHSLLDALADALASKEKNWQSSRALCVFSVLAARLLSLSPFPVVQQRCLDCLRRVRLIMLQWLEPLMEKKWSSNEENQLVWSERVLEVALGCYLTYDIDENHLETVLSLSNEVAQVIQCALVIQEHLPSQLDNLPPFVVSLVSRKTRLAVTIEPLLRRQILAESSGLDAALLRCWPSYTRGAGWTALAWPSDRWLTTTTTAAMAGKSLCVHYNLLDGTLMVDGSHLKRLPREYEDHLSYKKLFGTAILDVIPSHLINMRFATRQLRGGFQVHFQMYDDERLCIRTTGTGEDKSLYEFIPSGQLEGDFPMNLVDRHVHWLNLISGEVEFRPADHLWSPASHTWRIVRLESGERVLCHPSGILVDVRSRTATACHNVLSKVEQARWVQVIHQQEEDVLEITLPRYNGLAFLLRKGANQLESKQFRGLVIDMDQSIGALTGLQNRLVLCSLKTSTRKVIIPFGDVTYTQTDGLVTANVDFSSGVDVPHLVYNVDALLGRLVDDGTMKSKLYLCYLHAITSYVLIDNLTGRTGTEEALRMLRNASLRSFIQLGANELHLLDLIAQLTPKRDYYPVHLKSMQRVTWKNLPALSQHDDFYQAVLDILLNAAKFRDFHRELGLPSAPKRANELRLVERAAIRNATFRVDSFGAESFQINYDAPYQFDDGQTSTEREQSVIRMAKLVSLWPTAIQGSSNLLQDMVSWRAPIDGPLTSTDACLGYDAKWLKAAGSVLPKTWMRLQAALIKSSRDRDQYKIMFFLATLSFAGELQQELIQTLLAFACVPRLKQLEPPAYTIFDLSHGFVPVEATLLQFATAAAFDWTKCPEYNMPADNEETIQCWVDRRTNAHADALEGKTNEFVADLMSQWPSEAVAGHSTSGYTAYLDTGKAAAAASVLFAEWYHNHKLKLHLQDVQDVLRGMVGPEVAVLVRPNRWSAYQATRRTTHITIRSLFSSCEPPKLESYPESNLPTDKWITEQRAEGGCTRLRTLLDDLSQQSSQDHEKKYVEDLMTSFEALRSHTSPKMSVSASMITQYLIDHHLSCQAVVNRYRQQILSAVTSGHNLHAAIAAFPRLPLSALLELLANPNATPIPLSWAPTLINYGLSIVALQRSIRMVNSIKSPVDLYTELSNPGHIGWDPKRYPDWVVFEIENDLIIRQHQAEIAHSMISPQADMNTVMQLNMGEGKSSVIVPIVAAVLANRRDLVRIIALKPLSAQMFHLLVKKLGGLLNRQVFRMPFSRSLQLDESGVDRIQALHTECVQNAGVLLTQPEQILSFDLMGKEALNSHKTGLGEKLRAAQQWLDEHARDILDESDEILSVKFELIYTIGTQHSVELSPDRWCLVESLLSLISELACEVHSRFPNDIELRHSRPGSFPHLRLLNDNASGHLLDVLARTICHRGLPGVPVWLLRKDVREQLYRFLVDPNFDKASGKLLEAHAFTSDLIRDSLFLLRGLLAGGVLSFVLGKKRWRVNYGHDFSRSLLAVPYRAKDLPATRAEFSHPDATIVMTCLSYYYSGLTDDQLFVNFEGLYASDKADEEYSNWVTGITDLPQAYRYLNGVNLRDREQCIREVFPHLRFAKAVIDYYLDHTVFPKEMKEFPEKLSASGWDLGKPKTLPLTGFSGTNDSRLVLPLSVEQCDLPKQLRTNAEVLEVLLSPENSAYAALQHSVTTELSVDVLLDVVICADPPVRVILDAGAQVLELSNLDLSRRWLSMTPTTEAQAAVFVDDRDELVVVDRSGKVESLMTSSFSGQMDQCLVYLDEAHTRGTDLKLPLDYRALVTLGPGLNKDRLAQACMRMRKLGKGQSVMFCVPPEIVRQIQAESSTTDIQVSDVLKWSMLQTCSQTRALIPLWAAQGLRYQTHCAAWSGYRSDEGSEMTQARAKACVEPEMQTIKNRYWPDETRTFLDNIAPEVRSVRSKEIAAITIKCAEFAVSNFSSAALQEEQERELSPENEAERQVERPAEARPRKHNITSGLKQFVQSGYLINTGGFNKAFDGFQSTTAKKHWVGWPLGLLATTDYQLTSHIELTDNHLRPVHWILTSVLNPSKLLIISPFEAQHLLPEIRRLGKVRLHVYAPRLNISTRSLEDLTFITVPSIPQGSNWSAPDCMLQVNLFAGQLYLPSWDEYIALCRFLGLCHKPPTGDISTNADGFLNPRQREQYDNMMANACGFKQSPVGFLRMVFSMRRHGSVFARSHAGRLLHGELLRREDFGVLAGDGDGDVVMGGV